MFCGKKLNHELIIVAVRLISLNAKLRDLLFNILLQPVDNLKDDVQCCVRVCVCI